MIILLNKRKFICNTSANMEFSAMPAEEYVLIGNQLQPACSKGPRDSFGESFGPAGRFGSDDSGECQPPSELNESRRVGTGKSQQKNITSTSLPAPKESPKVQGTPSESPLDLSQREAFGSDRQAGVILLGFCPR